MEAIKKPFKINSRFSGHITMRLMFIKFATSFLLRSSRLRNFIQSLLKCNSTQGVMPRPALFFCVLTIGMSCTDSPLRTDVPDEPLVENFGYDSVVAETIQKLNHHNVLAIGEQHWNVEQHEFLKALISHPEFYAHARDIVVEFGNALYQEAVSEYLNNVN